MKQIHASLTVGASVFTLDQAFKVFGIQSFVAI